MSLAIEDQESTHISSRLIRNPFVPAIVAVLGIIAGVLGSVWTDEIKSAFPFHWYFPRPWHLSLHSVIFWACTIAAGGIFGFRQIHDDHERRKSQKELVDQTTALRLATEGISLRASHLEQAQMRMETQAEKLEQLIRTLPPENFLDFFSVLYCFAKKASDNAAGSSDAAALEDAVRRVLRIVATLAQIFDGNHPNTEYSANIMVFRASEHIPAGEHARIRQELKFWDSATVGVDLLKGVLQLRAEFSTTANSQNSEPDGKLPTFLLAIPRDHKSAKGRYLVLPGAPTSFVDKEPDFLADTKEVRSRCNDHGDFTDGIKDDVEAYFRQNPQIRSFACFPLLPSAQDGSDDKEKDPVGILNVHSSAADLLRGQGEPVEHFTAIIRPFQAMANDLLQRAIYANEVQSSAK